MTKVMHVDGTYIVSMCIYICILFVFFCRRVFDMRMLIWLSGFDMSLAWKNLRMQMQKAGKGG